MRPPAGQWQATSVPARPASIGALDGVRSVETALTTREVEQLTYEPGR
jgi:hypothetical protein